MGDKFEHIGAGATIINRSTLHNSFNAVKNLAGDEVADALIRAAEIINRSNNEEAVENFNAMNEELERERPRKHLLKSFWNGIVTALPVAELTVLGLEISKLFS